MKLKIILIFAIFATIFLSAQEIPKDTIFGKIKRVREKVVFLTEKENHQLFYYDDYGHSGFMGPQRTIDRFRDLWYSSDGCYYLNYERHFDPSRKVMRDLWFGKKDNFLNSYRFVYNKENKIKFEIDSSKYSVDKTTYYYEANGDETRIYENSDGDFFSHTFKRFKDNKLVTSKSMDEHGVVDEFKYYYNSDGKLSYRFYKNPNVWKKTSERTHTYGVQDTIGTFYKDLINEYDSKGRLIKIYRYSLYDDRNYEKPILTNTQVYEYDDIGNMTMMNNNYYFVYDKKNRLIQKNCCKDNNGKPRVYQKYKYNDKNQIKELEYFGENKVHKAVFRYKYDENNNWIEIVKNVDGKDMYKWIREFEYYK